MGGAGAVAGATGGREQVLPLARVEMGGALSGARLRSEAPPDSPPPDSQDVAKLKEAARQFESYYTYMLLKEMRRTVPKDGMLSSGIGYDTFQSMYDEAIAEQMSKTGSLGLANALLDQYRNAFGDASGVRGHAASFKLPEKIAEEGAEAILRGGRR